MARFRPPALWVSLPAVFFCVSALAAEANFYSLHEQWLKQQKEKPAKGEAVEQEFRRAFDNGALPETASAPMPEILRAPFSEVANADRPVELELGQILVVEGIDGLVKFVSSDEGVVTLESRDMQSLDLIGSALGNTYVHVWTPAGRTTFPVRVVQPKLLITKETARKRELVEKNRPFRFRYDSGRTAFYTGDKFREMDRSSLDFFQNFRLEGDTPYGGLEGNLQMQKDVNKHVLSETHVTLWDGRIGPLKNFNATAGDKRVEPALIVFPGGRVRGGEAEVWNDTRLLQYTGFYGRENTSLFGTISPTLSTERTRDSFLPGNVIDYAPTEQARFKVGAFTGSGRTRADELNRAGYGGISEIKLGPRTTMRNETDFDDEKWANRHSFVTQFEKLRVKSEFRDISKKS